MEDDKETEEILNRGNDWEVVSLTASTYAAAPGPEVVQPTDDDHSTVVIQDDDENSQAMFVSSHFVFPPSQHENLPIEPTEEEILNKSVSDLGPNKLSELGGEEGIVSEKNNEESWNMKGTSVPEEVHGVQFSEEKAKSLTVSHAEFEASKALEGMHMAEEEQNIYVASTFSYFLDEANISGSALGDENSVISEPNILAQLNLDSPSDPLVSPRSPKENKNSGSGLPCEAWWKRQAASLYAHAKEANAFWSVFVAAALMGLVILGQRWQQERWQAQQIKWQFNVNDEKMSRMVRSFARFKEVVVGGHRRGSVIRGSASAEH